MAIKVIAQRRLLKIGKNPGVKKFVMRPDLYIPIQEKKVFAEASTHSGISAGVIKAAWDAAGEVLRTWATEGHSVPLPGLGTMRFGVRSKAATVAKASIRIKTLGSSCVPTVASEQSSSEKEVKGKLSLRLEVKRTNVLQLQEALPATSSRVKSIVPLTPL